MKAQVSAGKSLLSPFQLLAPVGLLTVLATYFVYTQPEMFAQSPHRFLLMLGMTLSNQTVRVIVGHLMNRHPKFRHLPTMTCFAVIGYALLVAYCGTEAGAAEPFAPFVLYESSCRRHMCLRRILFLHMLVSIILTRLVFLSGRRLKCCLWTMR